MKILVVEDNEDSRNLLVKQLCAYGHEVTAAANGAEALGLALKETPDILVSDILMPKMDGYQLCYQWKQNDKLKNIPFVVYTASYTAGENEKFALTLGVNTFIRKPAEPDVFIQTLCDVFKKAKSGALAPAEVTLPEPSLYLTEYNKRLVAQLEEKMAQLEADITERKRIEHDLNKRLKELQCLYAIASIAQKPGITLDEMCQEVTELLPASWQYPEITCTKITLQEKQFRTSNCRETEWKQSSDIKIHGAKAGAIEVSYLEERPQIDEGPFLKEERLLIDAVAERLARLAEQKLVEKELRKKIT